jgi:hypothetical protein
LHHRTDKSLEDLARMFRPYIQGWINYYSHFYKSELTPTLYRIDAFLIRWARNKFKRLRQRPKGARDWLAAGRPSHSPSLCSLALSACEWPNIGSRMT